MCKKYRKYKNPEISHLLYEALVISIICGKCGSKVQKIFKEKNQLKH